MKTVDFTGTVSQATMRPQDVLPAIMDVLAEYHPDAFNRIVYALAFGDDKGFTQQQASVFYSELLADDSHGGWWTDARYHASACADTAMQEIAPAGYVFGAHPGDGCDYGFWRIDPLDAGCLKHTFIKQQGIDDTVWQCEVCDCIAEATDAQHPCAVCGTVLDDPRDYFCEFCEERVKEGT